MTHKELVSFNVPLDGFLIIVQEDALKIVQTIQIILLIGKVVLAWPYALKQILPNIIQIMSRGLVSQIAQHKNMQLIEIQFSEYVCLFVRAYNIQIILQEIVSKNAHMIQIYLGNLVQKLVLKLARLMRILMRKIKLVLVWSSVPLDLLQIIIHKDVLKCAQNKLFIMEILQHTHVLKNVPNFLNFLLIIWLKNVFMFVQIKLTELPIHESVKTH